MNQRSNSNNNARLPASSSSVGPPRGVPSGGVVPRRSPRIAARTDVSVGNSSTQSITAGARLNPAATTTMPNAPAAKEQPSGNKVLDMTNTFSAIQIGTDNNFRSVLNTSNQDTNNNSGLMMENSALLKNFDNGRCEFCSIDLKSQEGVMIQDCLHVFCRDCLQSAIETQKDVIQIPCPVSDEQKCGGFLSNAEVKELVRPDVYQEYLDRSLVVARKKMKNVFSCRTVGCSGWCEFEDGRKTFNCPVCREANCMECKAIHSGVDCSTYQTLARTGQLTKMAEIMEKERKSGWEQLTSIMKSTGHDSGMSSHEILVKMEVTDLLQNTMEFECPICFTDAAAGNGIILHECLHMFCRDCLINLVEHNEEATVKCPYIDGNYSCVCFMQAREVKALLPNDIYEKHLQRSMKLGESSIQNSFHCKTPDCRGWCVYEEGAKRFKCPICKKSNCISCNAIHTDSCEDYKNRLKQNANDKLSEEAVEKLIKEGKAMRCPKCKIPVEKTVGCDWIKCSACRTEICWITRGPRWGPKGYGDTSGGCRCKVNGKKCHPNCGNCH